MEILQNLQSLLAGLPDTWHSIPPGQKAVGAAMAAIVMIFLTRDTREKDTLSIFYGMGALLCMSYAAAIAAHLVE